MIKGPLAFLKLLLVRSSEVLILLLLLELWIVYHIAHAHTQTSAKDKKQYTKQYKQYKTRLLNYSNRCNNRVSVKIIENGFKTEKLWIKQVLRAKT